MKTLGHLSLLALLAGFCPLANAQTCAAGAPQVPIIRAEGLTERIGDIVWTCTGFTSGASVSFSATVLLNINVTNKTAEDSTANPLLTLESGLTSTPLKVSASTVQRGLVLEDARFAAPGSSFILRLSNVRVAANTLGLDPLQRVEAQAFASGVSSTPGSFAVAYTDRSFLTAEQGSTIACTGSPLPAQIDFANLITTKTAVATIRVTEASAPAFEKRPFAGETALAETGTRILLRYSNFPTGSRLFVSKAVAGLDAAQPTSAGAMGAAKSGGSYQPGGGTLLLSLVKDADENGAGGTLVFPRPADGSPIATLNDVSEIPLVNGAGQAVYEVVDDNPMTRQSAQIPTFLGLASTGGVTALGHVNALLGPVSTETTASPTAPVPRFAAVAPRPDCSVLEDCNASYFPKMTVTAPALTFSVPAGQTKSEKIKIANSSGGTMFWTASLNFTQGAGWMRTSPEWGSGSGTVTFTADARKLEPGTYAGTLTLDAGQGGSQTFPVSLEVTAATGPLPVVVDSIVNAASLASGPIAPGSLAVMTGFRLTGSNVSVTFDGVAARVLSTSNEKINLLVPAEIGAHSNVAQMVVTVDSFEPSSGAVVVAGAHPGIFSNGVLNHDYTLNGKRNPAKRGSVVEVFLTGLPLTGTVKARLNDAPAAVDYSGATAFSGIQQVNLTLPSDGPTGLVNLQVCSTIATKESCSPARGVYVTK